MNANERLIVALDFADMKPALELCDRLADRVVWYKVGLELFSRYGGGGDPAPEVREMVEKQAPKRVGLRFTPTRIVSWDHRKLGGGY